MKQLDYEGDLVKLWKDMDLDNSGELTFDEIDEESAALWSSFRRWCAVTFLASVDMISKLHGGRGNPRDPLRMEEFCDGVKRLGWQGGFEKVLFTSLDKNSVGAITGKDLRWLDHEKSKQRRRETAKSRDQAASEW